MPNIAEALNQVRDYAGQPCTVVLHDRVGAVLRYLRSETRYTEDDTPYREHLSEIYSPSNQQWDELEMLQVIDLIGTSNVREVRRWPDA